MQHISKPWNRQWGPGLSPYPLERLLQSAEETNLLMFALKKELFEVLDGGALTAAELADEWGASARKTAAVMDVLCAMGLLEKKDKHYFNSEISSVFLRRESPFAMHDMLWRRFHRLLSPEQLEEAITDTASKETCYNRAAKDPSYFTRIMVQNALVSGSIKRMGYLVAKHPRFKQFRKMLDLGGSHGLYTVAICQLHSRLKGVVFDLPEISNITTNYLHLYGMQQQVSVMGGDLFDDPLGEGYDLVLAVNVLHGSPDKIRQALRKIYRAMNNEGVAFFQHRYLDRKRTSPRRSVLFQLQRSLQVDTFYLPSLQEFMETAIITGFTVTGIFRFAEGDTCLRLEKWQP